MTRPDCIRIRNWDRFQHYKKRNPPWIRLYRDLIDQPEYRDLSDSAFRLLVELWLLASDFNPGGNVPYDVQLLAWRTGRASTDASIFPALQELADQRFIELPEIRDSSASTDASTSTPQRQSTENRKTPNGVSSETVPVSTMWEMWLERFGGKGRQPSLTPSRSKALTSLYREQLKAEDEPLAVFDKVLKTVERSEHHMSKREYQYPESLFRNADRRDRWVTEALSANGKSSGPDMRLLI